MEKRSNNDSDFVVPIMFSGYIFKWILIRIFFIVNNETIRAAYINPPGSFSFRLEVVRIKQNHKMIYKGYLLKCDSGSAIITYYSIFISLFYF